jgi:hypothetical protein
MKTETLVIIGIVAYFLLRRSTTSTGGAPLPGPVAITSGPTGSVPGTIQWVSCDSPSADPVMCSQLQQQFQVQEY